MSNKILLFCLVCGLTCSLAAQSYRANRRSRTRKGTQNVSVQQQSINTKDSDIKKSTSEGKVPASGKDTSPSGKLDFKKADLTLTAVKNVEEQLKKKLLERKIPSKLSSSASNTVDEAGENQENEKKAASEKFTFFSVIDYSIQTAPFSMLIKNFELTEVSWVPQSWYQDYLKELDKFKPIITEMRLAIQTHSDSKYRAAADKFKKHQEACLKLLKQKRPRISTIAHDSLVLQNTKIRRQNYLKLQQKKREAAMKRRQEQLKQLQQKNQQNQKPAQGGAK